MQLTCCGWQLEMLDQWEDVPEEWLLEGGFCKGLRVNPCRHVKSLAQD